MPELWFQLERGHTHNAPHPATFQVIHIVSISRRPSRYCFYPHDQTAPQFKPSSTNGTQELRGTR